MPTDPSIILGAKPPDLPNPIEAATRVMQLKNLGLEAQNRQTEGQMNSLKLSQEQRDYADQQSVRDAFKENTTVDQNGNTNLNKQGVLSSLAKTNPIKAQEIGLEFKKQSLDQLTQQHAITKEIVYGITDQASYSQAKDQLAQMGAPNLQQWPQQYDPNFVQRIKYGALSADGQLAQQNKQIDQQQKQMEINNKSKELQVQLGDKVDKASQALSNDLDPDKSRAGNFGAISAKVQSADRLKTLIGSFKEGNLPKAQTEELALGLSSMLAPGGGGSREQVAALVPKSAIGDASALASYLGNEPNGANQQEFVKMMEGTIERERQVSMDQLNKIRAGRLAGHDWLKKVAPEQYNQILRNKEMDPSKVVRGQYVDDKKASPDSGGDAVHVRLPDGRTGTIPRSNLGAAQKMGASIINE